MPDSVRLSIKVARTSRRPAFAQIADAIADEVHRGSLHPGDRLPSSRHLATELNVHRNTVLAAYQELEGQGWIIGRHGRGTFVSNDLPDQRARADDDPGARHGEDPIGFTLPRRELSAAGTPEPVRPGLISLTRNVGDPRLFPAEDLARAYRRALRRAGGALLDYGDQRGHPHLREELAKMLKTTRGLAVRADDVLVTHGSQMALYLAACAVVPRQGTIAVESLGYPLAWAAFRLAGAKLVPVPVDERGMVVDRLEQLTRRHKISAVYLTPHHQYPTTVTLSPDRRLQLLDLARARRIAVIEDDYDHEVHYQGRPLLPLASVDRDGVVVYIGSFSKVFAPGVRLGYVVAPGPVLDRMGALRHAIDRQGDPAIEFAVADLLEDGVMQRHVNKMRRVYEHRRDVLVQSLRTSLSDTLVFDMPTGGMALWARVTSGIDVANWSERAINTGVQFSPARVFAFDKRPRPFLRLAYAVHTEQALREAVTRMTTALPRGRTGQRQPTGGPGPRSRHGPGTPH